MLTLYGIPNCDTVKKARRWLDDHGVAYDFHDYKKSGIDADSLQRWIGKAGLDTVLNRRGTTWRKLPDEVKATVDDGNAIQLMIDQPSMIKRPVLESNDVLLVGFKADEYAVVLGS